MSLPNIRLGQGAVVFGVLSHAVYFIHGEHHRTAPKLLAASICAPLVIFAVLVKTFNASSMEAVQTTAWLLASYIGALWTSMLIYRVFFHNLGRFPGPAGARLTKLWHVLKVSRRIRNFEFLDELHHTYGEYVRTGPNEVSVTDPEIVELVHGPKSKCTKAAWYDLDHPKTALVQMRDKSMHDRRRRESWDKAFTAKSLVNYDSRVVRYADKLVEQIDNFAARPVNVAQWFNYFSFDVMGDLAFGRSFGALEQGQAHFAMEVIHAGTAPLGVLSPASWILNIMNSMVPPVLNPFSRLFQYSSDCINERQGMELRERDIISHLLDGNTFFGDPAQDRLLLLGDARVIIAAGSDTTAAALTHVFYYLAKLPEHAQKLRDELHEASFHDANLPMAGLRNLQHLNAVINETLRLCPPVPSGPLRNTPPEGLHVNGRYIPGGVTVLTPVYSIQRCPRAFKDPDSFVPERWYSRPDLILPKGEKAFFPFILGPYGCIGKQLALNELRTVIAKLVLKFDVSFVEEMGDEGNGKALLGESRDGFTVGMANLFLRFEARNG